MRIKVVLIATLISLIGFLPNLFSQDTVKTRFGTKLSTTLAYGEYRTVSKPGFEGGFFWQHRIHRSIDLRLGLEYFNINSYEQGGISYYYYTPVGSDESLRGIEMPIELLISLDGKDNKKINWFWNLGFSPGYLLELQRMTEFLYGRDPETSIYNFQNRSNYNYAASMNLECRAHLSELYNIHFIGGLTLSRPWDSVFDGYTVWNLSIAFSKNRKAKSSS